MRQGQQNRRGRGRARKPQSPLSRNYESNGPDVKIRGSASQIAEKYAALARDASSSGDNVLAESYLQHAEHYNRLIIVAQAQASAPAERQNGAERRGGNSGNSGEHDVAQLGAEQPEIAFLDDSGTRQKTGDGGTGEGQELAAEETGKATSRSASQPRRRTTNGAAGRPRMRRKATPAGEGDQPSDETRGTAKAGNGKAVAPPHEEPAG